VLPLLIFKEIVLVDAIPPDEEKPAVPVTLTVPIVVTAVRRAAPAPSLDVGKTRTIATPFESVSAVFGDKVATFELKLNVTKFDTTGFPVESAITTFAE